MKVRKKRGRESFVEEFRSCKGVGCNSHGSSVLCPVYNRVPTTHRRFDVGMSEPVLEILESD
jgi:hypothetical protein